MLFHHHRTSFLFVSQAVAELVSGNVSLAAASGICALSILQTFDVAQPRCG